MNPKDQEPGPDPGQSVLVIPGPGDHQAGDCCVNPKDQEITRRRSGQCCVNPKDQEITRRVIVV